MFAKKLLGDFSLSYYYIKENDKCKLEWFSLHEIYFINDRKFAKPLNTIKPISLNFEFNATLALGCFCYHITIYIVYISRLCYMIQKFQIFPKV